MGATRAAKERRLREGYYSTYFVGRGIDIGCGDDPVTVSCERFDILHGHGDAQVMAGVESGVYDFVYSSHCLEHMVDPRAAIRRWWELVKPGGYLLVVVPDEDLYEQGYYPSRFNEGHTATFTIEKQHSWSPVSINMVDLAASLAGARVFNIARYDTGYSYEGGVWDRTLGDRAEAHIEMLLRKAKGDD